MKITRVQLKEAIRSIVEKKLLEKSFDFGYITPGQHREQDPLIQLHGYGSMRLSQWKRKAVLFLEETLKKASADDFRSVQYYLKPDGILNNIVGLILEVDKRQKKLEESARVLPRGYRVVVSPCKVVGQGAGQKWISPRVFLNGKEIFGINPGAAFE
jgi:hypothetical protein